MYWRQTKRTLMVEVDGIAWTYNLMLNRYFPVAFLMQRDCDTVAYTLLRAEK